MTPIKFIAWYGSAVYVVDEAGYVQTVAMTDNPERAEWIAWSLARCHGVDHKSLAAAPLVRIEV